MEVSVESLTLITSDNSLSERSGYLVIPYKTFFSFFVRIGWFTGSRNGKTPFIFFSF